jgi:hypothetical protein
MSLKHIARGLIVLNLVALALTAVAAVIRGRTSLLDLFDLATYVAIGMGALGAMMSFGSSAGFDASTGFSASAADQPSGFMGALWSERNAGISAGVLLISGAVIWFGIVWVLAKLFRLV